MKTSIFLLQTWVVLTKALPAAESYRSDWCWLHGSQQLLHTTHTSSPLDKLPFHKQGTSPPPATSDYQPNPSSNSLCFTSTSQHCSKTTKPSDKEISSYNFPNLPMPEHVQPFTLLLWSNPAPKYQNKIQDFAFPCHPPRSWVWRQPVKKMLALITGITLVLCKSEVHTNATVSRKKSSNTSFSLRKSKDFRNTAKFTHKHLPCCPSQDHHKSGQAAS